MSKTTLGRYIFRTLKNVVDKGAMQQEQSRSSTVASVASAVQSPSCPFSPKISRTDENDFGISANIEEAIAVSEPKCKPYEAIPTPRGLPLVGTLFECLLNGGPSMYHTYCDKRHKELGPIYKEKVGSDEIVFVADKDLIQTVYKNEGKYPVHMVPEPWIMYNEMTGNKRGLFFMDGELWSQRRQNLNNTFLRLKTICQYAKDFNDIAEDVITCMKYNRDENMVLLDLEKELYKWSIESLGSMIFGRRMGCYANSSSDDNSFQMRPEEMEKFVHDVQQIFVESAAMSVFPPRLAKKYNLPMWTRFVEAVGSALEVAKGYVNESLKDVVEKSKRGEPVHGVLSKLLAKDGEIEESEIVRIVIDLFIAAADTTSHTTQWALYLLAKHPEAQERLFKDIRSVVPGNETVTHEHIENIPYVKAVVKEALRMYPVAPFLTRIMTKDIQLAEYLIPKDTLVLMSIYTTCRNPEYFPEPNSFKPERWLRTENKNEIFSTYACLPFGLGSRSCIGRRVAEKQMYILLAKTVNHYHLEVANEKELEINLRMITTPNEKVKIKFDERIQ
ncbi:Cytochrome P450 315a1, mitochondrial [Nymphon striatum]|nr:Cytochrome P450 315a1, mitochondrial [Nymphon striatum]